MKYHIVNHVRRHSEEATPDPIPNSEVKLFSADGSASCSV